MSHTRLHTQTLKAHTTVILVVPSCACCSVIYTILSIIPVYHSILVYPSISQYITVYRSISQHILQHMLVYYSIPQHITVDLSILQHITVYHNIPDQCLLESVVLLLQLFELCTGSSTFHARLTYLLLDDLEVNGELFHLLLESLTLSLETLTLCVCVCVCVCGRGGEGGGDNSLHVTKRDI